MTPKKFSLRKKKLFLDLRAYVFKRLTIPKGQACKKLKEAQGATPSASCLKIQWRRQTNEEVRMSNY